MKRPIAITFALPVESSTFLSQVLGKTNLNRNGVAAIHGHIGEKRLEIVHTGVGESIAGRRLEEFLRDQDFACLISSGFAGAASGNLQPGDLIMAENFSDPRLLSAARQILQTRAVRAIKLLTSGRMIQSDAERSAIAETDDAAAVDMETRSIANVCSVRGIPMLSLRVISDSARQPLPAPADVLFDMQRQRTPFLRLAAYVAGQPAVLGRLLRFREQIMKARQTLTDAIITLISKL